jgi:spore germination cell wall hydrolase CwlJ-like protein
MDLIPTGMTPDWSKIKMLAAAALPIILASCVPARANTEDSRLADRLRAQTEASAQTRLMPTDAEARERFLRKVANLLTPVSSDPAQPFDIENQSASDKARSLDCLTAAIYYEARSEPVDGQRAVAQVVLNRVRHPAFPSTVCGVVFQGHERRTGCQFSFTCDGSMNRPRQQSAWDRSRQIAAEALSGSVYAPVGNATHYHTTAVLPYWAAYLRKSAIVGSHIFYRWSGSAGEASAFHQRYGGLEPAQSFVQEAAAAGVNVQSGVTIHSGTPNGAVEQVSVDEGVVTIHRGGRIARRIAEMAAADDSEPAEAREPAQDSGSFGVTVHHGIPADS